MRAMVTAADRIHTMSSYFAAPDHSPVTPSVFAPRMLTVAKHALMRQYAEVGMIPRDALALLDVALGDPAAPVDVPVTAYVNAGAWKAKCVCGGIELVDVDEPIFMCCSCWNIAVDHAWRTVTFPPAPMRDAIAAALLARPSHRAWDADETIDDLVAQNVEHGIVPGVDAAMRAAAIAAMVEVDDDGVV